MTATQEADDDRPRRLTEEEIERVITAIPYPHAITEKHSIFARDQIVSIIRSELMSIDLCPSGLDELTERIVTQFEESRVKPGSMVGFAAAEAPSARFTQDNLSAVHKAGQAGMRGTGGAVGRIADLVSKQQSKAASDYDACTVFFSDIQTQHSIMHQKRPEMVSINISALLQVERPYAIEYHSVLFPGKILPEWYAVYSKLYGVPMPDLDQRDNAKVLRLYFDIERVVEYRVMVSEIRRSLLSSNSRVVRFYVSPMSIGVVDIWALDEEFHSYGMDISGDPELDSFNLLHGFAARLNLLGVKGIPGIRDVQADKFDIWSMMTMGQSQRRLNGNVYEYRLSSIWPMRFGWERAQLLWKFVGVTMVDRDQTGANAWVILDGGAKGAPHDIIREAIGNDENAALDYQKKAVAAGKSIVTRPTTPANATYWSQLWYAKTVGTNLREIMVRDDVDPRYTISNRPFEVLEMYGIIAARRIMLEELYLAFSGGRDKPDFSVRHFSILADFVCHTGVIRPISNLLIQGRSTLSKATFARQFNTLVTPAIHGVDEPIGDVSAAIMIASRAAIGPRAFEYDQNVNEGITAEEIKASLRSGSRSSSAELDKLIATLSETADAPLYITGIEGQAAIEAAAAMAGDEDIDIQIANEYEAADMPPGLDDDEEEGGTSAVRRDDDALLIDDDLDETVEFGASEVKDDEPQTSGSRRSRQSTASRRRSRGARAPIMSEALTEAVRNMGGTIEAASATIPPPPPACPVPRSSLRRGGGEESAPRAPRQKARVLTFVDD